MWNRCVKGLFLPVFVEKRKELDPDAKPSSSVEGTNRGPGKRQRKG